MKLRGIKEKVKWKPANMLGHGQNLDGNSEYANTKLFEIKKVDKAFMQEECCCLMEKYETISLRKTCFISTPFFYYDIERILNQNSTLT